MKIKVTRPNPEYPLAWVSVESDLTKTDLNNAMENFISVLRNQRITMLGPFEFNSTKNVIEAPVLLEDEHVVLPKKRTRAKSNAGI